MTWVLQVTYLKSLLWLKPYNKANGKSDHHIFDLFKFCFKEFKAYPIYWIVYLMTFIYKVASPPTTWFNFIMLVKSTNNNTKKTLKIWSVLFYKVLDCCKNVTFWLKSCLLYHLFLRIYFVIVLLMSCVLCRDIIR